MTEITENQRKKIIKVEQLEKFAELIDTLYGSTMGASGSNHAPGQVPDPGATAGTSKYLREDGTWVIPPNFSGSYIDLTDKPTIPDAQIQSDWNQTNTSSKDYIKNKPSSMPASDVSAWATAANKPTYSKSEVGLGNVTNDAQVKRTEMGVANGIATLGSDGKVPASQLPSGVGPTVNKTWAELKAMRDGGTLVPGQWYRITDYTCTTTQVDTQSAGHVFDIIVRADANNVLNENAYAAKHSGDTYFTNANAKLNAWELKYSLDNDTTKYYWADSTNGKGVIYYMKDEWNNECPYDFKNIQFKRYKITACTKSPNLVGLYASGDAHGITANTATTYWSYTFCMYDLNENTPCDVSTFQDKYWSDEGILYKTYNNNIKPYFTTNYDVEPATEQIALNDTVFITDTDICDIGEEYGEFYGFCNNTFGNGCSNNTFGNDCSTNTFGQGCGNNTFGNSCNRNTFVGSYHYNTFGNDCGHNTFWDHCFFNTFGNSCHYNTFRNDCNNNALGNSCCDNTFGNGCNNNSFGNGCNNNSFGNECSRITFSKDYCYYNIVENGNQYITLTSTQTTSYVEQLRNIKICQGVNNTDATKTISHNTVNDTFQTEYKATNSQIINV